MLEPYCERVISSISNFVLWKTHCVKDTALCARVWNIKHMSSSLLGKPLGVRYEVLYSLIFPKIRKVACLVVWLHHVTKLNILIYWYLIGYYTERAWKNNPTHSNRSSIQSAIYCCVPIPLTMPLTNNVSSSSFENEQLSQRFIFSL